MPNIFVTDIIEPIDSTLTQFSADVRETFPSKELNKIIKKVEKITATPITVIVGGESGTPIANNLYEKNAFWNLSFIRDDEKSFSKVQISKVKTIVAEYFKGYSKNAKLEFDTINY